MKEDYFDIKRDLSYNQICILPKCEYCGSRGHFHREGCAELKHYYRADSQGHYDIQAVMRDVRNGLDVEIDFTAYDDVLLKYLRGQEKYYKK